jgi:RNA processing factor Prp31
MALELNELKLKIYEYVESRMQFIAPNMSIIVGAATAAKLMGKNHLAFVGLSLTVICFFR